MNRRGFSLLEVMIAILVLGIGILGVMALFPIAITRAVQAHRVTNARFLAERADLIVNIRQLAGREHIPTPDPAISNLSNGEAAPDYTTHAVIDPLGWHDMNADFPQLANEYGNDGNMPVRYRRVTLDDSGNRVAAPPAQFHYLSEIGVTRDIMLPNLFPMPDVSSNNLGVPLRRISLTSRPIGSRNNVPYPFTPLPGLTDRRSILEAVSLPDKYIARFKEFPESPLTQRDSQGRIISIGFPSTVHDLSHAQTSRLDIGAKATMLDQSGRRSQVRELPDDELSIMLNGGAWRVSWDARKPLPIGFEVGEVVIEVPDYRYTWMLTIRKRGIKRGYECEIDCVVFHKRPTGDPAQELVYEATQSSSTYRDPRVSPMNETDGNLIDITFDDRPAIKKGGWVFDPQHCYWYQVQDIREETDVSARIEIDRRAQEWIRSLIIPQGVVEVFSLDTRESVVTPKSHRQRHYDVIR